MTYIYFILNPDNNTVKIGQSNTPESRLKALQTSSSSELKLLAIFDSNLFNENDLHLKFKKYNIRGEWFNYHNDIVDFINGNNTATVITKPKVNTCYYKINTRVIVDNKHGAITRYVGSSKNRNLQRCIINYDVKFDDNSSYDNVTYQEILLESTNKPNIDGWYYYID